MGQGKVNSGFTAMAEFPIPLVGSGEQDTPSATPKRGELLGFISSQLLDELVQEALQKTNAASVVIALGEPDNLTCRARAGDSPIEVGTRINTGSGLTGLCASTGVIQSCMNTESDSRVDFDACRELDIGSMIVAPLFDNEQWLGLLEVFYHRPFGFGMYDLQVLQEFTDKLPERLRRGSSSTDRTGHGAAAVSSFAGKEKTGGISRWQKIAIYSLAALACLIIGLRLGWRVLGSNLASAQAQATVTSSVHATPAKSLDSAVVSGALVKGTLINRVDPAYPADALQQGIEGEVVLQVRVGKDGAVYDAKAISGEPILSQAALEAVKQWRFSPYKVNDKPVDMPAEITFRFGLAKQKG